MKRASTLELPTLDFGRADDRLSPGWLMHAVLRAADAVRGSGLAWSTDVPRGSVSSCSRSILSLPPGPADKALARGVPAVILRLPAPGLRLLARTASEAAPTDASRLLAAVARRLDGLDGQPVFEDEYLVAPDGSGCAATSTGSASGCGSPLLARPGRVFEGESRSGGREFRWVFLVAVLVAPVFACVLLALPAAVAAWRPRARWPALVALTPVLLYALQARRGASSAARACHGRGDFRDPRRGSACRLRASVWVGPTCGGGRSRLTAAVRSLRCRKRKDRCTEGKRPRREPMRTDQPPESRRLEPWAPEGWLPKRRAPDAGSPAPAGSKRRRLCPGRLRSDGAAVAGDSGRAVGAGRPGGRLGGGPASDP